MSLKTYFLLLSSFSALLTLQAADTEVNLLRADRIEAAVMHGKVTGIRGYMMNDIARERYIIAHKQYIAGEDCFHIDVNANGEATFTFPDPLPAPYAENPGELIHLYVGIDPQPPVSAFRISGRVKLNKGAIRLSRGPTFQPAADWQNFDYQGSPFFILLTPAAGASISLADIKMTPVYPAIGGEIALPDGGKLTRFLLPENADFVTRWSIAMWRGWLWKLTGVALPIETVKTVAPTPGAFAAFRDKSLERGWRLQVNREGITLNCSEEDDVAPALFDYLRMALGCAFYAPGCEKLPKTPIAALPAIDRQTKPHYQAMLHSNHYPLMSGGKKRDLRYICNDVNYYHLNNPDWIHVLNTTLPAELYYKEHPEYFMMDSNGNRVVSFRPSYTHQCFSNPDARRIMLKGLTDITKAQPGLHRMCFEPGDTDLFCLCPKCVEFNGTKKTNIDLLMDFSNEAAAAVKKIDPDMAIYRCAYLNRCFPPSKVKVADNIHIFFCLTEHVMPCTLHPDCERNQAGIKMAEQWRQALGGDTSRLGFMTYDDARPLSLARMAEYYNQFASGDFYMFQWHYTPLATQFVMPRWNLGEDADKLMEEFDLNYYGKAGQAMHDVTLFIDEYARNYTHKANEGKLTALFCGHQMHVSASAFDRKALDHIYTLFDKAIAAAGDDKTIRARIFQEKKCVVAEDFIQFGPATCATDKELEAFVNRLTDFITMAREAPDKFGGITPDQPMRNFLLSTTGLSIPDTGKFWANESVVDDFLAAPMSFFSAADKIPSGWYFKPLSMRGVESPTLYSYQCPPRYSLALRRPGCGKSTATITLTLSETPSAASFLAIEGQDDDKPGVSQMNITVNGKTIFSGLNRFPERSWGRMGITIPAGLLKAGQNTIVIANTTPDTPSRSARFTDAAQAAKDPQWGWIVLSEAYWLDPNGDFDRFAKGELNQTWCFYNGNSMGNANVHNGQIELTDAEMGPAFYYKHQQPKLAITPDGQVKLTVKASGNGTLRVGLWNYRPYKGDNGDVVSLSGYCGSQTKLLPRSESPAFQLTETPQTVTCILTPPKGTGLVIPRIYAENGAHATVTAFRMELLQPQNE